MKYYVAVRDKMKMALYLDKGHRVLAGYLVFKAESHDEVERLIVDVCLFDKVIEEGTFHRESDYELF